MWQQSYTAANIILKVVFMLTCLNCQHASPEAATVCPNCGASLRPARVAADLDRAEAAVEAGELEQASELLLRVDGGLIGLSPAERDRHQLTARAFYVQGMVYYARGEAAAAYEELRRVRQHLHEQPGLLLVRTLLRLANISYYQGHVNQSLDYYAECATAAAAAQLPDQQALALINRAGTYLELGDMAAAVADYDAALKVAETAGDPSAMAITYVGIAAIYAEQGPYALAMSNAHQGLALNEQVNPPRRRCVVLCQAAGVLVRGGDFGQGERYLRLAHELAQQVDIWLNHQMVAANMAELIRLQGDRHGWFKYVVQTLYHPADDSILNASTALNLAYCAIRLHDQKVINNLLRWVERLLVQQVSMSELDQSLLTYTHALLNATTGRWDAALLLFEQVFARNKLLPSTQAEVWEHYARTLHQQAVAEGDAAGLTAAEAARHEAVSRYRALGLDWRADFNFSNVI